MWTRGLLGAAVALILIVASGCVSQSDFDQHVSQINQKHSQLDAWLGTHGNSAQYETVMEWVIRISNVVCDLEDLDPAHEAIVRDELCADEAGDPTSPPPDPPKLGGG